MGISGLTPFRQPGLLIRVDCSLQQDNGSTGNSVNILHRQHYSNAKQKHAKMYY
jgi:hypothetical protein